MVRKTLVIYHRVDADGVSSCLIAKKYYQAKGIFVDTLGWNYGDEVPDIKELTERYNAITLVDISFPPEIMVQLKESKAIVTYIDHHETALKAAEENNFNGMPGKREIGKAACELCWEYFNPGKTLPHFIHLLGAYDTWRKEEVDWEKEALPLQYAIRTEYGMRPGEWEKDWDELIDDTSDLLDYYLDEGYGILRYLKQTCEVWVKSYGFEVTVAGKYKGICMMSPMFGSSCYESVLSEYDLYLIVNRKDPNLFNVSIYKEPDRIPEFSCGAYLKENYKGGGHASAAGGRLNLEQFTRLVSEQKI